MYPSELREVLEAERGNAVLAWVLVVFLVATSVAEALAGDRLWSLFVLAVAALAVVPAVAYREPLAMLPWEVLALASLPAITRALVAGRTIGHVTLTGRVTTYVAVAAVALVVAIEVDVFTPAKMNHTFAVLFVVVATMAAAGIWAVAQWLSDLYLGTSFLLGRGPPHEVEEALMWDFVAATVAGVGAGLVFEYYFRRRVRGEERVPPTLQEGEEEPQ